MRKLRSASLKIGKVIHDELSDIIDIFPIVAPQNTTGIFAVYKRNSLRVRNTKDIFNYEEVANVDISIIAPTYLESVEKSIDVKMYLEHLHGEFKTQKDEVINISDITLTDCSESWTGESYVQTMRFDIMMVNEHDEI